MQKALLTGATGFVGRYVKDLLLASGFEVRCLVRNLERSQSLAQPGVERILGDLAQPETLTETVKDVDLVIHLGGLMTALQRDEFEKVNGHGNRFPRNHVPQLVHSSCIYAMRTKQSMR